ncbi:hypothetical protein J3R83DRAFT_2334 [Lanmaoa asiatica]|nr:hypothetical protein J3R83DRAFT_2334 [Lanmaoa asiatica]
MNKSPSGFNATEHLCAPAPHLPVSTDTSSTSRPADILDAVFASSDRLWDMGYQNTQLEDRDGTDEGTVVLLYKFLDTEGAANLAEKKKAVSDIIKTWESHANVRFQERKSSGDDVDIRIKFDPSKGSWSVVGKALPPTYQIDNHAPTLNLGWLSGHKTPSNADKGTILHEFGHALGMMHEHQSPARGEKITLKEKEVYDYYLPLLRYDRNLVKTQVIQVYDAARSNFSHFDKQSIMMYFMPARLNYENEEVKLNFELSELDKAYVALIYPYNDPSKLLRAMGTIHIPDGDATKIIEPLNGTEPLSDRLKNVRDRFLEYNKANIEAAALLRGGSDPTDSEKFHSDVA